MISRKAFSLALAFAGFAAITLAAKPASALIAVTSPINTTFTGTDGTTSDITGMYDTQFTDPDGSAVTNTSDIPFTSDDITLDYSPTAFEDLVHPADIVVNNTFIGTDILGTDDGGILDLSLAGTFTGPTGVIDDVGGSELVFTGTATVTGGSLGLTGTAPFTADVTQADVLPSVSDEAIAPLQAQPASFTATYGTLAPAVPETSPIALLGLGLLPVGVVAYRRRTKAVH